MSNNRLDLPYNFGNTLNELLKAIENVFGNIDPLIPYLRNRLDIDTIVGSDLDDLGLFLSILRYVGQSDEDYRTRLQSWLVSPQIKPNLQSIITLAETIIGITPTIKEYPEFDFTSHTGKSHPGIWVGFTFAQLATYEDLINEFILQVGNFKAAGVPLFWGGFLITAEIISNIIDNPDADIHFIVGFSDDYNNFEALRIGSGTVGPAGTVGYVVSKPFVIDEFLTPILYTLLQEYVITDIVETLELLTVVLSADEETFTAIQELLDLLALTTIVYDETVDFADELDLLIVDMFYQELLTSIDDALELLAVLTFEEVTFTPSTDPDELELLVTINGEDEDIPASDELDLINIVIIEAEDPYAGTSSGEIEVSIPLTVGGGTVGSDPGNEGRVGTGGILVSIEEAYV